MALRLRNVMMPLRTSVRRTLATAAEESSSDPHESNIELSVLAECCYCDPCCPLQLVVCQGIVAAVKFGLRLVFRI